MALSRCISFQDFFFGGGVNILHYAFTYLHDTQSLCLLHLAQDGSENLVQLLAELCAGPGDERRHKSPNEYGSKL